MRQHSKELLLLLLVGIFIAFVMVISWWDITHQGSKQEPAHIDLDSSSSGVYTGTYDADYIYCGAELFEKLASTIYTGNITWGTFVIRSEDDFRVEWGGNSVEGSYTSKLICDDGRCNWDIEYERWRLDTVKWMWFLEGDNWIWMSEGTLEHSDGGEQAGVQADDTH